MSNNKSYSDSFKCPCPRDIFIAPNKTSSFIVDKETGDINLTVCNEKLKLKGELIQADYNESNNKSPKYIANKPRIVKSIKINDQAIIKPDSSGLLKIELKTPKSEMYTLSDVDSKNNIYLEQGGEVISKVKIPEIKLIQASSTEGIKKYNLYRNSDVVSTIEIPYYVPTGNSTTSFTCDDVKSCLNFTSSVLSGNYLLQYNNISKTITPIAAPATTNITTPSKDSVVLVANLVDLTALQTNGAGTQLFQFTGTDTIISGVQMFQGLTYSINDQAKITDMSTEVSHVLIDTGMMTGTTTTNHPIITRNLNGSSLLRIVFKKISGTVTAVDSFILNKNGSTLDTFNISTSNNVTNRILPTRIQFAETDNFSITLPNNTSLSGVLAFYYTENSIN